MKTSKLSIFLIAGVMLINCVTTSGQQNLIGTRRNTIPIAVPYLLIPPDARLASMGNSGVATSPDNYSLYSNPAKYAFIEKDFGFSLSGLKQYRSGLFKTFYIPSGTLYIKPNDKSAIAVYASYLVVDKITIMDISGESLHEYRPKEYSVSIAYSRKLNDYLSGAVAARYIGFNPYGEKTGKTLAADLALYYNREIELFEMDALLSWGLNISNIGSKIPFYYTKIEYRDFLPTNLRLGPGITFKIEEIAQLGFFIDFNKLLVPTPPIYQLDEFGQLVIGNDGRPLIYKGKCRDVSAIRGMIQSFYDAPDGLKEELNEISIGFGTEFLLVLNDFRIAIRGGYFHEHKTKGYRKYFSRGLGIHYKFISLDYARRTSASQKSYPPNERWLTLSFGFGNRHSGANNNISSL